MSQISPITPFLWFDRNAEEAVDFYLSIFANSRILSTYRYSEVGRDIHGGTPGRIMSIDFEINGQPFTALNGGPVFQFNEAISFQILCDTQEEIDYYWTRLSEGGDPAAQQCGWLKDKFGVSWQVVAKVLNKMLRNPESASSQRAMEAMLKMKKLEIKALEKAFQDS